MQIAKDKIALTVEDYIKAHPREYEIVKKMVAMKRNLTRDEYATVEGSEDMRGLYEISETLMGMLVQRLDETEMTWLSTHEGGRWFAKKFNVFALPNKIDK